MRLIAGAWVVRGGDVLLLERKGGTSHGMWVPPGGLVNYGEDAATAAARETREECGLVVAEPEFLRDWDWETHNGTWRVEQFIGEVPDGAVRLSHEHTGYRWMDPREYEREHLVNAVAPAPRFVDWFAQMRLSVDAVCDWMAARGPHASP